MNNESNESVEEAKPLFERLRNSILPIKPTDALPVRMLKNSGFYLFAVMVLLISVVLGGAIMLVL